VQETRADDALAQPIRYCSPLALDAMLSEAALCTPRKGVSSCSRCAHSIDLCPRGALQSHCRHRGVVGAALEEEFELLAGRLARIPVGPADGPDCLSGSYYEEVSGEGLCRDVGEAVDICLSGPEDGGSGPCSPGLAQMQSGYSQPQQAGPLIQSPRSPRFDGSEMFTDSSPRVVVDGCIRRCCK